MIEIAIALGVIGFALVAIMGILPAGLEVQRDNRSETIINQDGTFWIEAIRNGARGLDDLTNRVESIEVVFMDYSKDPPEEVQVANRPVPYNRAPFTFGDGYLTGSNVVGLLTTPAQMPNSFVRAVVAAISGAAAEKGETQDEREFGFRYEMTVRIEGGGSTPSFTALSTNTVLLPSDPPADPLATLHEIQLRFAYPYINNNRRPTRSQSYRSVLSRLTLGITNNLADVPNFFFVQ